MKANKPAPIDSLQIESWLRDIGYDPKSLTDANTNWQFVVTHPPGSPHQLAVLNPKDRPRAVVVLAHVTVAPMHVAAFQELDEESKHSFLQDLNSVLTREYTEYALKGLENGVACPTEFQISASRYDDGLSLDSLARSISSVFKGMQSAIMCFQKHLPPQFSGGAGTFEFRRMIQ